MSPTPTVKFMRRQYHEKVQKLVALILVGVMAMAMLTACGGGGGSAGAGNSQMEDIIISAFNGARSKGTPTLTNDAGQKAKAAEALNHINNGMIPVKYAEQGSVGGDTATGTAFLQVVIVPTVEDIDDYPENSTALVTAEAMTMDSARKYAANVGKVEDEDDQAFVDSITSMGVATKTIDGKTYMAIAIRFEENE